MLDDETLLCSRKHGGVSCCHGEWRPPGAHKTPNGRTLCTSCLPFFIALGPEKTGTTDLYNRISLLSSVVPAARKETGWWTENILSSPHHVSMAGYGIKYFKELAEAVGSQVVDPNACGADRLSTRSGAAAVTSVGMRAVKRPGWLVERERERKAGGLWGRRLEEGLDEGLDEGLEEAKQSSGGRPAACDLITGEATPAMLYWQHHGQQLLPR